MKENQTPVKQANQSKEKDGRKKGLPWWLSILLAIASYSVFKYLIPEMDLANPNFQNLAQAAPSFAPITAIPFLLLAAKQLYDSDPGEQDNTTDSEQEENSTE